MNSPHDAGQAPTPSPEPSPAGTEQWLLRLYVAGQTPRSVLAFANLRQICEEYLASHTERVLVGLDLKPRA